MSDKVNQSRVYMNLKEQETWDVLFKMVSIVPPALVCDVFVIMAASNPKFVQPALNWAVEILTAAIRYEKDDDDLNSWMEGMYLSINVNGVTIEIDKRE